MSESAVKRKCMWVTKAPVPVSRHKKQWLLFHFSCQNLPDYYLLWPALARKHAGKESLRNIVQPSYPDKIMKLPHSAQSGFCLQQFINNLLILILRIFPKSSLSSASTTFDTRYHLFFFPHKITFPIFSDQTRFSWLLSLSPYITWDMSPFSLTTTVLCFPDLLPLCFNSSCNFHSFKL